MFANEATVVSIINSLALVAVILDCAETLYGHRMFASDGIFSWAARREEYGHASRVLDRLLAYPQFLHVIALELICATAGLVLGAPYAFFCVCLILPLRLLTSLRYGGFGGEGSSQMILVVLAGLVAYGLAPSPLARSAAIWFIAGQSLLAYFTSGIVKVLHEDWRSGAAIRYVFASELFGIPWVSRLLANSRGLCRCICWSVIAFEIAGPFSVLFGPSVCFGFITCCAAFHFSIALFHGLNRFLPAFTAALPAVWLAANDLNKSL